ncbi:peptidase C60 sortase A and B [Arthrobacter sp. Soil782]|uniref:class F sortase n=1 Tax=Arthrobacter sp. Soil782 TaxID=1736410 RepID=UPI000701574D|nr:class F sortase [Arthrobacter sp. Soil782]KRF05241.1 peptidase C60 sortase A and B [Arthrobacter sp. Soil782]
MTSRLRDRCGSLLAAATVPLLLLTGCAPPSSSDAVGAQPTFTVAAPSSLPAEGTTTAPGPPPTNSEASAEPAPASPAASGAPAENASPAPAPAPVDATPQVFGRSLPVSLSMPTHGVKSGLLYLGLQPNGSLEVPPGHPGAPASWYRNSPTPGETGPSIFLGHVNASDGGPGVFAWIKQLNPGDTIEIAREDGTVATFAVERGEQYSKDAFPTQAVYGNTEGPELRLITCDGYDPATGTFNDNYVVYAKLLP